MRRIDAVEDNLARVGVLQPGDDTQQRCLSAARRPEQRNKLAVREIQRDVVQRFERTERLVDVANFDAHETCSSGTERFARHST